MSRNFVMGFPVVQDVEEVLENLKNKKVVARFEYGDSMSPILVNGEYAILVPIDAISDVNIGDAVFCEVNGCYLTHMVWMKSNGYCLIGSSHGEINGWTDKVYAIAEKTNIIEGE